MSTDRRSLAFDVALTALLMAFAAVEAASASSSAGRVAAAELLQTGAVGFRRRAPVTAALVFLAGAIVEVAPGTVHTGEAGVVALLILLYSVGRFRIWEQRQAGRIVLGIGLAVLVVRESTDTGLADWLSDLVLIALTSAGAYLVGLGVRRRAEREQEFAASSELQEQAWASQRQEMVETERKRIARELHDVVGHALAGIALTAGAARNQPGSAPEVEEALDLILTNTQKAAADMRRLVGLLRTESDADLAPQPALDSLDALIAGAGEAGVRVTLTVTGEPVPAGRSVELVVYRIVQEGITNALRHARGAPVEVCLSWQGDRLEVAVANGTAIRQGRDEGGDGGGGGHGLVGLRERVMLHGGTFEAGPVPGGGFRVAACLPLT